MYIMWTFYAPLKKTAKKMCFYKYVSQYTIFQMLTLFPIWELCKGNQLPKIFNFYFAPRNIPITKKWTKTEVVSLFKSSKICNWKWTINVRNFWNSVCCFLFTFCALYHLWTVTKKIKGICLAVNLKKQMIKLILLPKLFWLLSIQPYFFVEPATFVAESST